MKTVGQLLGDPTSNLSKQMEKAQKVMRQNDLEVARLVASGLTVEQAWSQLLFGRKES